MAFVIAYLIIMFFFYFSTAMMGKLFGFDAQVYYYGVKFQLGRHKWTTANVFWIWSFGTLFTVLLGAICTYLYNYFKEKVALGNLIAVWGAVIAFSIAAAQGLLPVLDSGNDHSPFYTNLSIVFNYWALPIPVLYIICIVFLILLAFVSTNISRSFLSFSYSFSKVNKRERKRKYYFETVIIPYILASGLLLLFFQETYRFIGFDMQNLVYLVVIGAALVFSMFIINISDIKSDDVLRYKNLQQLSAALFVIMMILLVFLSVTWQGFYLPF
ncbi:MAG: hypothetical protein JWO03_4117 [Bacteroidetes bacterium]|nr:hypothetical protein [Bacteroidota bacterium]